MIELLLLLETKEDKIAFQKLYEKIYRRLLYVALGILKKPQDAEDIVHDVFAIIAKDFSKYRKKTEREMLSLGIVMTRNASINLLRKRERHRETVIEIKDDLLKAEGDPDPLEDILKNESVENLERALLQVKPEDRDLLILRYYHEMSYKEIAKTLGIKKKTVDMRLYRVKKKLKEVLDHEKE